MSKFGVLKMVCQVEYHALEELVRREYDADWEFAPSEEKDNDTYSLYDVSEKAELNRYDRARLQDFRNDHDDGRFIARLLLQDLVNRDVIPPAEYLVHVSW